MSEDLANVLPNNVAVPTATLTLRIIKSLEFRTERSLVLHDINLQSTTVSELKDIARRVVHTQSQWKPYRNVNLGPCIIFWAHTMKLYTKAHGTKTANLIINLDHDEWIFDDNTKTLAELGFENETEVSFFNREMYDRYKANPQTSWE